MKLLKAYVRSARIDEIVKALEAAGAPGITLSTVHGVGYGQHSYLSILRPSLRRTPELIKVEVVCSDEEVDHLLCCIVDAGCTGYRGDGIVFVTPVEQAVKVRTGQRGPECLQGAAK